MTQPSSDFYRIKRLPPYVFAVVNEQKARDRAAGLDIIDLGMGNPDSPVAPHIVDKLRETLSQPKVDGYSVSRGIKGLRRAQAGYYQRRFGVELCPDKEVIVTIGSKEGLANLLSAITAPGDVIMVPNPSYPIHPYGSIIAGGSVWHIPNTTGPEFFEQLHRAIKHCKPKPIALIINYPCNPTAEVVDLAFYEQVVDICKMHGIWLISDIAYGEIYFGDTPPPSVLQVKGAKDIAIEFTTMSKTYSMAGWRVGFAAGNPHLVGALTRIKSYLDYGAFTPIQVAATAAINGSQQCVEDLRTLYRERRDVLVDGLHQAGWKVQTPEASMFVWAELPEAYRKVGSLAFAQALIQHAQVAVAPGIGFGEYGDSHVRIALVENKQRLRQAVRNIKQFLAMDSEEVLHGLAAKLS
ncbi:MAG: LL-diaminopimelate aminotransferase [Alphaproteobacteria bacterium]|nr:MAG: LL-diaminopimelate aminotransferase [Alphaproteobacteria bacterium]